MINNFDKNHFLTKLLQTYNQEVTLAEWLTRWPAKPFPFGSAGSSPAGDDFLIIFIYILFFLSYIH